MNKYFYRLFVAIQFWITALCIHAELNTHVSRIFMNVIPVNSQFSSNTVRRILQDKDGFIWFGTMDGLYRYDGYEVMSFRSNMNNPNLLTNNEITCLAEDNDHNLWIGTKEGISILNRETFHIIHFSVSFFSGQNIQAITCASSGEMWIGVNNIIYVYNPVTEEIRNLKDSLAGSGSGINHIYEDSFGDMWVLIWGNGIHRFKKGGTVVHYPLIGTKNNPFRIYQDNKNQYWVSTWGDGVYRFYPNNNPETMYETYPIYKKGDTQVEDKFFSMVQDDSYHYLWLVSYSGIYALKSNSDNSVEQVDISEIFKHSNNYFSEAVKDKDGNLWVATFDEGAFFISFNKPVVHNIGLEEIDELGITPNITAIYKDNNDILWLNQNRIGLCFYDIKTNKTITYKEVNGLKDAERLVDISCFKEFENNEIWAATNYSSRINIIERAGRELKYKELIDLNKLFGATGSVGTIYQDSKKNIWVTTANSVLIKPYPGELQVFSRELKGITGIAEIANGTVWMSSGKNGMYCIEFDYETSICDYKITNYNKTNSALPSNNIVTMCSDKGTGLWLGGKEGNLIFYNTLKNTFEDYTQMCNMMSEAIQNIVVDNKNNVWISTNKWIVAYNKTIRASRSYSVSDGLLVNSFRAGAYYFDAVNDLLYFGGNKGVCGLPSFNIESKHTKNTNVIISDVKISGLSLLNGSENEKFKALSQKIMLSPEDKNLEIHFTALDYINPDKIIYAYRTNKNDDNWIYTTRNFISYNQLTKGKTFLYVKATDENRIWSSNITIVEIYKKPACYETWWAYMLYLFIAIMMMYWAFCIARNKVQLKQKLKIAQIEKEKSEELAQVKLRYFTNISHELLTPLTIISCLIDETETTLKQRITQFSLMRSNVNRLKRLFQQVLDFRKMESGNMKLRVTCGNLSAFIKDICENNFMLLFEKKKIKFTYISVPECIVGYFDANKVDKIVYNLLTNALKYTPLGGEVSVKAESFVRNGLSFVAIVISDTGIGISPENIDNIFTRFYNNKNINAEQTNGIGLSLTRELVELHHGIISVESSVNKGTTFFVEIPIDKISFAEVELEECLPVIINSNNCGLPEIDIFPSLSSEERLQKESIKLLLVEDNEDILLTLKGILQKQYEIFTATNGKRALEVVKENDVDIIVSDVMMPKIDGMELCQLIKNDINTSHISILLLTAKNSIDDRIACYEAGADGYISKPFDINLLKARISNFLSNKRKKQVEFKLNNEINISSLVPPSLDEDFLKRAIDVIEEFMNDADFDVDYFAEQMNMSKSTLYRKIKAIIGLSPNEFIREIKLKHACCMLRDKSRMVSEVAYLVGFSDPRYFATCFKNAFGVTPSEFQKNENDECLDNMIVDS